VQLAEFAEVAHRVGGIDAAISLGERRPCDSIRPKPLSTCFRVDAAKIFGQMTTRAPGTP
jgi:hypothetical protein